MSVEISKIRIKLNQTEVELTPEEARELYKALGNLFGEKPKVIKETVVKHERTPYMPPYRWYSIDEHSTNGIPIQVYCATSKDWLPKVITGTSSTTSQALIEHALS